MHSSATMPSRAVHSTVRYGGHARHRNGSHQQFGIVREGSRGAINISAKVNVMFYIAARTIKKQPLSESNDETFLRFLCYLFGRHTLLITIGASANTKKSTTKRPSIYRHMCRIQLMPTCWRSGWRAIGRSLSKPWQMTLATVRITFSYSIPCN